MERPHSTATVNSEPGKQTNRNPDRIARVCCGFVRAVGKATTASHTNGKLFLLLLIGGAVCAAVEDSSAQPPVNQRPDKPEL
jgi:hypothetical protein